MMLTSTGQNAGANLLTGWYVDLRATGFSGSRRLLRVCENSIEDQSYGVPLFGLYLFPFCSPERATAIRIRWIAVSFWLRRGDKAGADWNRTVYRPRLTLGPAADRMWGFLEPALGSVSQFGFGE